MRSTKHLPLIATLLATLALSGCASMNETECRVADWRTIGYEDGAQGYSGNRIGQYRKDCGKHGVTPNLDEYTAGRDQGLREFCKPANGFRVGARGNDYAGQCPADMDNDFVSAYQTGRQLYTLRARVDDTGSTLSSLRYELDGMDSRIAKIAARIIDPVTTTEDRAQLVLDTKRLAERKGEIKAQIPQLESDLAHYQRELEDYRATLNYIE
jgi:hypothetical protein